MANRARAAVAVRKRAAGRQACRREIRARAPALWPALGHARRAAAVARHVHSDLAVALGQTCLSLLQSLSAAMGVANRPWALALTDAHASGPVIYGAGALLPLTAAMLIAGAAVAWVWFRWRS